MSYLFKFFHWSVLQKWTSLPAHIIGIGWANIHSFALLIGVGACTQLLWWHLSKLQIHTPFAPAPPHLGVYSTDTVVHMWNDKGILIDVKETADMEPSPLYIGNFPKAGSGENGWYAGICVKQERKRERMCNTLVCMCICIEYWWIVVEVGWWVHRS